MARLGLAALLVASACHSRPRPAGSPSCPWRTQSAEAGESRCREHDPWCGPDTMNACLDDIGYRRNGPRHTIPGVAPEPSAPRCSYDGQCEATGLCDRSECQFIEPPKPPSGTSVDNQFCEGTTGENPFARRFCGCVDHACNWFEQ